MEATGIGLAGAALLAAAVYGLRYCTRDDPGLAGAAVKTASTGLLALLLWRFAGLPLFWTIALGMTLGAAGDWFLARRGEAAFLAGMAAFGAGHLAYAGGMLARSLELGLDGVSLAEGTALAALLALVASTEVWLAPRTGALRWPVRAYVLLIGLMGAAAVLLPAHPGQPALRLGAALFLASDLLLALRLFVVADPARQRALSRALWPAYWAGQALIGWGALLFWLPKG
ncbi:lysoplasmalogenase [Rhodobacter sp. SGA-6-6]|uniref:lysoplasmalogenase n=1 Tax=Rhodobacter sp. SGA-6-6 TaxID=2710882 RepID=UPI0013EA995D|nr:lysoplasmalogenase [Rhodobacter sp. SGA-6-6]NGM45637.1 lysoplasmalogenase [Rhodobacter sp. SGA-6-6]